MESHIIIGIKKNNNKSIPTFISFAFGENKCGILKVFSMQ